ncbi:hypothetical protein [Streptomyces chartreusis]|uniref:hypothetical protein n=1 Tax=Streptomyces chartreusis TaxID=1969 RepID=UPI00380B51D6
MHDLAPNPEDDVKTDAQAALAESVGARAILCFRTTMDIPANDTSAYAQPTMTVRIEGDVDSGSAELADQISRGIERANATYGRSG